MGLKNGTAVNMLTSKECKHYEYVGDCHTHPYLNKMGAKAMIGPSSSDYMEWWLYTPSNYTFSIHFVVSGDTVFLILTRDVTKMGHKLLSVALTSTTPDTDVTNEPMRLDYKLADIYGNVVNTDQELDFWESRFPDHARRFTEANLAMNAALGDLLGFEYYQGKLKSEGIILERQTTQEVYGPAVIIGKTLTPKTTAKWIDDSKATRCTSCKRAFSMTFRKHHCRNCGRIFCEQCSSSQAPVKNRLSRWGGNTAGVKVARVCDECYSMCR
ncbi:FYVE zinc finger domain-containing protein [Paraburkholderia azotifigens]|uniref:FYVE zinc finger domain-containing protein n=1 Tax=Paraburkholderia azotifigens TaxID=2057004 RepID=A0A5C6VDZ7_9BURK|nr:FYVE zinc finger domain-containing protein [Paraburkholderia azotifigens]TXC83632.1 hypothetical protein FRZ40_24940 [Paraburkholderia azotifigens]